LYEDGGGCEWKVWLQAFEWFLKSQNVENENEKLHSDGIVHGLLRDELVLQLSPYQIAIFKLNDHFMPKKILRMSVMNFVI